MRLKYNNMFKNELQNKGCSCMACSSSWQNIMFLNTQCIAMPIKIRPQLYEVQLLCLKCFEKKIDIQIPDAVVRDAVPLFKNRVLKRLIIYGCSSMRGSSSQQNIIIF